jgi:hypothetical protein
MAYISCIGHDPAGLCTEWLRKAPQTRYLLAMTSGVWFRQVEAEIGTIETLGILLDFALLTIR